MKLESLSLGICSGEEPHGAGQNLASRLAACAVELLLAGKDRLLTGMIDNQLRATPLDEILGQTKELDRNMYELANVLASV